MHIKLSIEDGETYFNIASAKNEKNEKINCLTERRLIFNIFSFEDKNPASNNTLTEKSQQN